MEYNKDNCTRYEWDTIKWGVPNVVGEKEHFIDVL